MDININRIFEVDNVLLVEYNEENKLELLNKKERKNIMNKILIKPHHFIHIIKLYGSGIERFVPDEKNGS